MEMEHLSNLSQPWMIMGDLNYIKEDGECIGGQPQPLAVMEEFNSCINNCGTMEIRTISGNMSWFNE